MATYGLNDISTTMLAQWQYGDAECIKEIKAINFDHDRIYPLCLIIEPNSVMPSIYEGWENYDYDVYFCMLWKKENRDVATRDLKWDNIQRIGNEWLDNVLNNYDNEDIILNDESLEIERIKSFGNDKVLAVKFSFTLQAFRTCFNPKEFYPDRYYSPTEVEIYDTDAAPTLLYVVVNPSCRGWWRFDGWKTVNLYNTERYTTVLKDMSANGYVIPGRLAIDQAPHDFTCHNIGSDFYNYSAIEECNVSQANNIHYGHFTGGVTPLTADMRVPVYSNDGGTSTTDPANNENGILNSHGWSLGFVFQIGADSLADNHSRLYDTGDGGASVGGTPVHKYGLSIYLDGGDIVVTFTQPGGGTITAQWTLSTIFGGGLYARADRTIALMITFNGSDTISISIPDRTLPLTTALAADSPLWALNDNYLWSENATDPAWFTLSMRNRCYEAIAFNYDLFTETDKHADKIRNPNQYQAQEILNFWADKYGTEGYI